MLIVLSNRPERVRANGHLWGDFDVFTSPAATIRQAHYDLAAHALTEGWDESVRVIQDDVYFDLPWPEHRKDITSYHRAMRTWHTCPRAFSATPQGWDTLATVWRMEGKTCELWRPDHWWDSARLIQETGRG